MHHDSNASFYGWLLIVGVISFGFFLLWDFQFLDRLLIGDITYLSSVILLIFVASSVYLGRAAWILSVQKRHAFLLEISPDASLDESHPQSWALEHLKLQRWNNDQCGHESELLLTRLIERVHRGHNSGWFLTDILIRLGLIGTVIGFVLMLSSVYELKQSDIQQLQHLLATMGGGMQVALYTTLSGLGTAMLVSLQCQWLDHCADRLISQIITLGIKGDSPS